MEIWGWKCIKRATTAGVNDCSDVLRPESQYAIEEPRADCKRKPICIDCHSRCSAAGRRAPNLLSSCEWSLAVGYARLGGDGAVGSVRGAEPSAEWPSLPPSLM